MIKLERTTLRTHIVDGPIYQYAYVLWIVYIGGRMVNKEKKIWHYQIGIAPTQIKLPIPSFIMKFKTRPIIKNLYLLFIPMILIYMPYWLGLNLIVLIWVIFKATLEWIIKPNEETAYWTTLIWFIIAVVFIVLYIFK